MERYPYFLYPVVTELKACDDNTRKEALKAFIACNVGDPDALASLTGNMKTDIRTFYSVNDGATMSTDDTIDSFIAKFGSTIDLPPDSPLLTKVSIEPASPSLPIEETMAEVKNLVKKREYAAALEIMESIYLNNPKKSIYFADQIRFIKKMMLNESKK